MPYMGAVTVRGGDAIKDAVSRVVEGLGMDLSTATRMFYHQVAPQQRIPFAVAYPERLSPEVEARSAETRQRRQMVATAGQHDAPAALFQRGL
ncbi:MAG: type II toxin-antitoxin system RelB/DinJ family antitoxin, partial [Bifidobacteriaceae bacterium]|nr:type II toxin-antitoxin system RelB/DinJ family antitoxin [Bifidobacteriaceae bacterium]